MGNFAQRIWALTVVPLIAVSHTASGDTGDPQQISSGFGDPVFGFLLTLAIASLFIGTLLRDRSGLTLAALCGSSLCVLLYAGGIAYDMAGLRSLDTRGNALLLCVALALYCGSRLNRGVISDTSLAPLPERTLNAAEWLLIAVAVFSLVVDGTWSASLIRIISVVGYTLAFTLVWVSFVSWRDGNRHALFMTLAWLWLVLALGTHQLGWSSGEFLARHGTHLAVAGALALVAGGYVDGIIGYRHSWARQLKHQQHTGDLLRVERSRRDFADEVTRLIRTLEPGLYEEAILTRFLEDLANMVPVASAAVAVSHRGDLRLVVLGEEEIRESFESILATREQLLQSVCLSDRAAVIHSDDLGVNPAGDSASCLGIVPVNADRNEWAGVLLARSGELEFGRDELELVSDFANQAYDAVRSAQQFRQVRREAETDALTGMFNRRAVLVRGERCFRKARSLKQSLSVLFVDVDHFKHINDEYGHAVGDSALRLVGSICGESLRDQDFIGRYGGEEFLAVLPGANADDAGHVAERLRAAVEDGVLSVEDRKLTLTVSVGIAECAPKFADFDSMLRAADRALYRAKREGRNRVVHHRLMLKGDRASRPGS